jgi:hypothetical protein
MQKVGRITHKRFIAGEKMYLEVLKERLRDENKGFIRKYIRQKIKLVA